jgi:hypothetical protein
MSKSLIRKNQLHPDINDLVGQYGSGYFSSNNSTVLITGNQTISGVKTFATGIFAPNLVYNTGNQTISGAKIFPNKIGIGSSIAEFGFVNSDDGLLQIEGNGVGELRLGGIGTDGTKKISFYDDSVLNFQIIHDVANDYENVHFSGKNVNFSFANSGIFNSGIDLQGSKLLNFTQDIINVNSNFLISGNSNSDFILANSANQITGTIVSGNVIGFNASVIQIGAGNVRITGSGAGVTINSFSNRFRTSGQYAQVSILHTGNNGYIMYGNTAV